MSSWLNKWHIDARGKPKRRNRNKKILDFNTHQTANIFWQLLYEWMQKNTKSNPDKSEKQVQKVFFTL